MLRYTVLRLLIFFGCLILFWLLGLRSPDQQLLLLGLSAVVSLVLSYFLLRRPRDEFAEKIADRVERRRAARQDAVGSDEEAEDAETATGADAGRPGDEPDRR